MGWPQQNWQFLPGVFIFNQSACDEKRCDAEIVGDPFGFQFYAPHGALGSGLRYSVTHQIA
jgi:hypothetical protein